MKSERTRVMFAGPPEVITKIRSKTLKDPDIARIAQVTTTPERAGSIIRTTIRPSPAPSILADSIIEGSMRCRFAKMMIM
jgi:hypothetical protein